MISGQDLYNVLAAMVPLYVAMFLAYGSVKWWGIFTPQQCGGINRFVALFAVPLLSFEFISSNNPFTMNFRFLAADTLAKVVVLCLLALWAKFARGGCLEWTITLFSLSTLPNTLVMGIPLLRAMYGKFSGDLMVQIVVLQCIIWYTMLLFLFEYLAACRLLAEQFPGTAGSIVSFKVDPDVVSLDNGYDGGLETEAAVGHDGKLHVTVRKSTSSARPSCASKAGLSLTPRPSNMTGVEIYSIHSSRNPTPRGSSFNHSEMNVYHPDAAAFSLHSSKGPTPRTSNFDEETMISKGTLLNPSLTSPRYAPPLYMYSTRPPIPTLSSPKPVGSDHKPVGSDHKSLGNSDLKLDVVTPGFENADLKEGGGGELGRDEFSFGNRDPPSLTKVGSNSTAELAPKSKEMPPTAVMSKLILVMVWRKLIRNPNSYSSLIGLTWSLVAARWSLTMPTILKGSIAILSNAGLGMAMFSLGLFMALQPRIIACGNTVAAFSMAVKFLTGPAVMAAASIAIGIRGDLLHVAIVQAALPQGIVPFVFAKEYNVHPDILSTGVIFGMLVALPVTLLYYFLLGL